VIKYLELLIVIFILIAIVICALFFRNNLKEYFSVVGSISTLIASGAAYIAIKEWRRKNPAIHIISTQPIYTEKEGPNNKQIRFCAYILCTNYGEFPTSIKDFSLILTNRDSSVSNLLRGRSGCRIPREVNIDHRNPITISSMSGVNLPISYGEKRFPLFKPIKQGEAVGGIVFFKGNFQEDFSTNTSIKVEAIDYSDNVYISSTIPNKLTQEAIYFLEEMVGTNDISPFIKK
jgi:hypothetical protein